jgi:ubiquinone/menaquinone biosynthesis C-methylase UbiE
MIDKIYAHAIQKSPRLRKLLAYRIYQFLAKRYRMREWTFMNYGYMPAGRGEAPLPLETADEPDRSSIALYNHVAGAIPLDGRDALEVGCGRGGGSSFIARYLRPRTMKGVDFSQKAVLFCRQTHVVEGLSFECADAERLPFPDESFDAVVNVESSHCYGSVPAFLSEVRRVLRVGGTFLFADFRPANQLAALREDLSRSGLDLVRETEITANVLASLESGEGRRLHLMKTALGGIMLRYFHELVGQRGSVIFEQFRTGVVRYFSFVLQRT